MASQPSDQVLSPETLAFYKEALGVLEKAGIPVLVGGAYAFACYTGIARHTKDLDIFVRPADVERTLAALQAAGYRTELTFPHWIGKAFKDDDFVDVIFSSSNGISTVTDEWFDHAVEDEMYGIPVKLCPPEEILWTKIYIMERERYDGADVAHLLRAKAEQLDWSRLLRHVGEHWRLLLSHLILFGFIYPGERSRIPAPVMRDLLRRLDAELDSNHAEARLLQGAFISRAQYLHDLEEWGYRDARLQPAGPLNEEEIARWTAGIAIDGPGTQP
jgi:hypothetical protein